MPLTTKKEVSQKITRIPKRNKLNRNKGVDTMKYCGIIKLKEKPLAIQKKLRDEWE